MHVLRRFLRILLVSVLVLWARMLWVGFRLGSVVGPYKHASPGEVTTTVSPVVSLEHPWKIIHAETTKTVATARSSKPLAPTTSFAACLMVKEDNDLLYEWIAYHYTVLPLRYLVVGSDVGNTQNPRDVLEPWAQSSDLQYWILEGDTFGHRHSARPRDDKETQQQAAHHDFMARQRGFITSCSEFLKRRNMTWVTFVDSDEFIVPNHFDSTESAVRNEPKERGSTRELRFRMREHLPPSNTNATVWDAIQLITQGVGGKQLDRCYSMPRLLFGALENASACPGSKPVDELAKSEFRFSQMSTLRFKQHAKKGDFETGRFGKVLVDLSRISWDEILLKEPKNIHRPFNPACAKPVVAFDESVFYANHYVGSWERYISRIDARRGCKEWIGRAFLQDGVACEQAIHEWFPRFLSLVESREVAKFLLGVQRIASDSDSNNNTRIMVPLKLDDCPNAR